MTNHTRRVLVTGLPAALAGCAAPSMEQCDPNDRGSWNYVRCRRRYAERQQRLEQRVDAADARIALAQSERRRLDDEIAALQRDLQQAQQRNAVLEAELAQLQQRIREGAAVRATLRAYVQSLELHLDGIEAGLDNALAYRPPADLLNQGCAMRYNEARDALYLARREASVLRAELSRIWLQFAAGQIAEEVAEELLERLLLRIGLRFINPWIGLVTTLLDIRDFLRAIEASRSAVERHREAAASACAP